MPPTNPNQPPPEQRLVVVHMEGNPACACSRCADPFADPDLDRAIADLPPDVPQPPPVPRVVPRPPINPVSVDDAPLDDATLAANANSFSAAALREVTPDRSGRPKRSAEEISMDAFKPSASPVGHFCRGFQGVDSVFSPTAYGNCDGATKTFINDVTEISGQIPFTKARNLQSAVDDPTATPGRRDYSILTGGLSEDDVALGSLRAMGVEVTDAVTTGLSQFLSPQVETVFKDPMEDIGVHYIDPYSSITRRGGDNILQVVRHAKTNFLFSPVMVRNKKVSIVNNHNRREIEQVVDRNRTRFVYNRKFWSSQLVIKNVSMDQTLTTIDVGMMIPPWTIPPSQRQQNHASMEFLKDHGPVYNSGIGFLNLKQNYAQVFLHNMESDLVVKARLAGFYPLFLIKNCLLQESRNFGVNGWQFSTMNKRPKSYLTLLGFWKGSEDNGDLTIISVTNAKNQLIVIN